MPVGAALPDGEKTLTAPAAAKPCSAISAGAAVHFAGLATFVMQASESVISVCFNSSLLKYGGDMAVGAMTILSSVMQFALLPLQGIAQGSQPITSYNYGAVRNADRVRATFRKLLVGCACCIRRRCGALSCWPRRVRAMFSTGRGCWPSRPAPCASTARCFSSACRSPARLLLSPSATPRAVLPKFFAGGAAQPRRYTWLNRGRHAIAVTCTAFPVCMGSSKGAAPKLEQPASVQEKET